MAGWGPPESCGHTVSASQGRAATRHLGPARPLARRRATRGYGLLLCVPPEPCPRPTLGHAQRVARRAGQPHPGRAQALHTAPCHPGTGFGSALPPSWGRGGRNLPEKTSNMGGPLPPSFFSSGGLETQSPCQFVLAPPPSKHALVGGGAHSLVSAASFLPRMEDATLVAHVDGWLALRLLHVFFFLHK